VKEVIANHFLPTHHLPNVTPQDLSKLGACILKEAIELRKEKQESLSLEILELTTSAGFETDSINENKARVLINLNRSAEAVKLLKELRSSKKTGHSRVCSKNTSIIRKEFTRKIKRNPNKK
jgi:hypothetical protein